MLAKLITLMLALTAFHAKAQVGPSQFTNIEAAKKWFATSYSVYEMEKTSIKGPKNQTAEIFAFYSPRGSGVVRTEGWFYFCSEKSICSLAAMLDLGEASKWREKPKINFKSPYLTINSDDRAIIKIKIEN